MEATIDEVKQGILILGGVIKLKQSVLFKELLNIYFNLSKRLKWQQLEKFSKLHAI